MQGPTTEKALRAAIYCRISETDDDFDKVAVQEKNLREFCEKHGYAVTDAAVYVDDGVSAFLPGKERPSYKRMLADAKAEKFDVITATFQDRLSRQTSEVLDLLTICRASGISWHTIADGLVDPTSGDDELMAYLRGWVGSREITTRTKRQRQRFEEQRRAGLPLWGNRPFGFHRDRVRHFHGDPDNPVDEAAEVAWAYEQVASGATIYSVIKTWNEKGVRTSRGKAWSYASVQQLLRRPSNAALMEIDGQIDDAIECQWEPLVDRDLWDLVRAKVTGDPDEVRRQFEPKWLLAGIARCGLCSQPLRSSVGSDRKGSFKVYRCKRSMLPAIPPEFREDGTKILHASAKALVLDAMARDAVVAAFMFAPTRLLPDDHGSAADLRRVQIELHNVGEEMREVSESVGLPGFRTSTLRQRAAQLARRQAELQAEHDAIIKRDANSAMMIESRSAMFGHGHRVNMDDAVALRKELEARFDSLPLRQRRTLVASLLDVVAYPGRKPDRFVIWHRVATSLNDEGAEPPTFIRPVDLIVSVPEGAGSAGDDER